MDLRQACRTKILLLLPLLRPVMPLKMLLLFPTRWLPAVAAFEPSCVIDDGGKGLTCCSGCVRTAFTFLSSKFCPSGGEDTKIPDGAETSINVEVSVL